MKFKSMQSQQLTMMISLLLASILLLGAAFIGLSHRYIVQEKQGQLSQDATYISNFTSTYLTANATLDPLYQAYVSSVAQLTNSYIMISDSDGLILFFADGTDTHTAIEAGSVIPSDIVTDIQEDGQYTGTSTLGGLFPDKQFVSGVPIVSGSSTIGIVLVTASRAAITELWDAIGMIFLICAIIILIVAWILSNITARHIAKPLKDIADAARKFGHGEFDTRVTQYTDRPDEIGELCRAFNAMAESLSQSEQQRSEFIANISHELKTPMTTISGFADGILDGTIPQQEEKKYLQIISDETKRLSRLVRRMLELSRLDAKETVTAQERFDICETMLRVLVSLEPKINARKLDVATDLPDEGILVWGDTDQITQVCYNLLDNAIKFAPEGSTIGVQIRQYGGKVHVGVRNGGETIPAEELPFLFDRFHKTDKSRSIDKDGVGLGLYIVKAILDNHKEDITVTSENGITTFTFTLTPA